MPDDLQIPIVSAGPGSRAPVSSSYHPRASYSRASRGVSPRAVVAAGGIACAVLLTGIGGWALLHRGPTVVPTIEADTRPIRVKPENPGGMQIAEGEDSGTGPQVMAPAAEAPAPQALRAQMQLPAAPAPQVPADAPPAVPSVSAAPGASPLPDTPKPAARAAVPAAGPGRSAAASPGAAAAVPAPPAAAGGTMVQLAAVDTEAAAQAEWQRLAKKLPDLLGERRPVLQKAERDGKAIWRVRIAGFGDMADATGFCGKVRTRGGSCTIASF